MTFHLQTDKKLFRFHIIFIGTNPMKDGIARRNNGDNPATVYILYGNLYGRET
jgi:hypothetical protein